MAEATDTLGLLKQNLVDAGCSEDLIADCVAFAKAGKWKQLLALLSKQKRSLLDSVHSGQKQIDCLDFLVYQINKEYI